VKEIELLIRSMHKDGKTPGAIATELHARGLKNNLGKFLTPDMVAGFLRHGAEPSMPLTKPPAVLPDLLDGLGDEAYDFAEELPAKYRGGYDHIGGAVYERSYLPGVLGEWPEHTDFRPDNLNVRD
jgi:hypothetical protein